MPTLYEEILELSRKLQETPVLHRICVLDCIATEKHCFKIQHDAKEDYVKSLFSPKGDRLWREVQRLNAYGFLYVIPRSAWYEILKGADRLTSEPYSLGGVPVIDLNRGD